MIMTKDKVRELNAMADVRMPSNETLPAEGLYTLSTTQDSETIRKSSNDRSADYFFMGMVIPAHKAAAVCQLLQDDDGMMPSPVILLKNTSENGVSTTRSSGKEYASTRFDTPVTIKNIEIIPGRHEVKVNGKSIVLTFSEFRILQTLVSKPGWVFSRDKIIHEVHGDDYNCTERAVDVQVTGLRKKLGDAGSNIETVRGVGYRFIE